MKNGSGSKVARWLIVAAMCALPVQGFAGIGSSQILPADGTTGQDVVIGNGVKTGHIQDGAVTAAKLGIVCPSGQYLQYNGSTWVCSVGTAGPQGPQGVAGPQGPAGPMPHYANVIVVAKNGGDFSDPVAAVNSITDASATNPYLVKVMPGVYEVSQTIVLNNYVSLEGSGITSTIIRGTTIDTTVSTVDGNTISNIRIDGNGTALNASALNNNDVYVNHVILTALGLALRADRIRLIGDDIKAYSSGDGFYFTNNSPQITNSVIVASGTGVYIKNEYGYDGRLLPSPTFNGLVIEGQIGFYNDMCYYTPKIRNSRITGSIFSLKTRSTYPGSYMTYVSNTELIGSTNTDRWSGYASPAMNVCAGVTDDAGAFYPNICPNAVAY